MHKPLFIGIAVFFSILLVAAVTLGIASFIHGHASPNSQPTSGTPKIPFGESGSSGGSYNAGGMMGSSTPSASSMTIQGRDSISIAVRDFLHDAATVADSLNGGQFYLGYHFDEATTSVSSTSSPSYVIDYFQTSQSFNVVLYQEPLGSVREQMEAYLMSALSISQGQMCDLNYQVAVPNDVNAFYAGRNLGFSFCPDAIPLP